MRKFQCLLCAVLALSLPARADHLTVYAAAGVKAPVEQLAKDFTVASGHTVRLVFDTAGAAERRFLADAEATVLITTLQRIEAAERGGRLAHGMTVRIGDTVGGLAVAPGAAKPDISSADKLRAVLLAAPSIAFSNPARGATVGAHFMQVIDALGIRDQVMAKATLADDGLQTVQLVRRGAASLGVTQVSEILQSDRSMLLGPFPAPFDLSSTYAMWRKKEATAAAVAFEHLLTSPAERAKLLQFGLRAPVDR